jgi:hypothetical protein
MSTRGVSNRNPTEMAPNATHSQPVHPSLATIVPLPMAVSRGETHQAKALGSAVHLPSEPVGAEIRA